MRKFLLSALALAAFTSNAQDLPAPSPKGKVEQVVGLTNVEVQYSRPSARDRKIFGDLVPFGQVWRTGANMCTMVSFDGPVKVEGNDLKPGKYSLFTIPAEDSWTVIFNSNTELGGAEDRKEEEDVLKVKVPRNKIEFKETFTISFDAVRDDKARMDLAWENSQASVWIEADATEQGIRNIKEALASEKADFRSYNNAANFCLERKMMTEDALKWATKSTELDKRFWNMHTLAKAQAANGKYKEAIASAEASIALAKEANYDAYVKMNQEKIEEWRKTSSK